MSIERKVEVGARDDHILVSGYALLPQTTRAGNVAQTLAVVALVDPTNHRVTEASTTLATPLANTFVCERLIGTDLMNETSEFVEYLAAHYLGHAQKAVIVAFNDLAKRYRHRAA